MGQWRKAANTQEDNHVAWSSCAYRRVTASPQLPDHLYIKVAFPAPCQQFPFPFPFPIAPRRHAVCAWICRVTQNSVRSRFCNVGFCSNVVPGVAGMMEGQIGVCSARCFSFADCPHGPCCWEWRPKPRLISQARRQAVWTLVHLQPVSVVLLDRRLSA